MLDKETREIIKEHKLKNIYKEILTKLFLW